MSLLLRNGFHVMSQDDKDRQKRQRKRNIFLLIILIGVIALLYALIILSRA